VVPFCCIPANTTAFGSCGGQRSGCCLGLVCIDGICT
jgi:hypothetical protein